MPQQQALITRRFWFFLEWIVLGILLPFTNFLPLTLFINVTLIKDNEINRKKIIIFSISFFLYMYLQLSFLFYPQGQTMKTSPYSLSPTMCGNKVCTVCIILNIAEFGLILVTITTMLIASVICLRGRVMRALRWPTAPALLLLLPPNSTTTHSWCWLAVSSQGWDTHKHTQVNPNPSQPLNWIPNSKPCHNPQTDLYSCKEQPKCSPHSKNVLISLFKCKLHYYYYYFCVFRFFYMLIKGWGWTQSDNRKQSFYKK